MKETVGSDDSNQGRAQAESTAAHVDEDSNPHGNDAANGPSQKDQHKALNQTPSARHLRSLVLLLLSS